MSPNNPFVPKRSTIVKMVAAFVGIVFVIALPASAVMYLVIVHS